LGARDRPRTAGPCEPALLRSDNTPPVKDHGMAFVPEARQLAPTE